MNTAHIMLTPNTNQDCMQCTRYCNIFWINNKMICKALAFRLLTLSMVGFKARHFSENCKSSLGTTNPNNTAIILSLDTEKRFDRLVGLFSLHIPQQIWIHLIFYQLCQNIIQLPLFMHEPMDPHQNHSWQEELGKYAHYLHYYLLFL